MTDCGFPIIEYDAGMSSRERGHAHGEAHRIAIKELVDIRTQLMREKNPALTDELIDQLANRQWEISSDFNSELMVELEGIADAAGVSRNDIVILNNYTDFRDIQIDDQGCSLAYVNAGNGPIIGQTWDMHGSAKRYVCCIDIHDNDERMVVFSVVGCVGMMGFNSHGGVLGVNNINTNRAEAGAIWPVIVRSALAKESLSDMANCLTDSPKTSGHNYLIAVKDQAQMWEVAPHCNDMVDEKRSGQHGNMIHTNHCLGSEMKHRETTISQNSTTHIRYELLQKKIDRVTNFEQMFELMNDHENYPKSICSNFQTDAQDPSITCGGAVGDLAGGKITMWRGDQLYDENYVEHEFNLYASLS